MTHIEALELDRVPKHLLVLGGGYVGLEMAQALRRFGSRVTVIGGTTPWLTAKIAMSRKRCGNSSTTRGSRC